LGLVSQQLDVACDTVCSLPLGNSISSIRARISDIHEQAQKSAESLASIVSSLSHIENYMRAASERRSQESPEFTMAAFTMEHPLGPVLPKVPSNNIFARLEKLKDFVEQAGGFMEQTGDPTNVWFSLPENNKAANDALRTWPFQDMQIIRLNATDPRGPMDVRQYKIDLNYLDDAVWNEVKRRTGWQ
jgi:hypothetical protein